MSMAAVLTRLDGVNNGLQWEKIGNRYFCHITLGKVGLPLKYKGWVRRGDSIQIYERTEVCDREGLLGYQPGLESLRSLPICSRHPPNNDFAGNKGGFQVGHLTGLLSRSDSSDELTAEACIDNHKAVDMIDRLLDEEKPIMASPCYDLLTLQRSDSYPNMLVQRRGLYDHIAAPLDGTGRGGSEIGLNISRRGDSVDGDDFGLNTDIYTFEPPEKDQDKILVYFHVPERADDTGTEPEKTNSDPVSDPTEADPTSTSKRSDDEKPEVYTVGTIKIGNHTYTYPDENAAAFTPIFDQIRADMNTDLGTLQTNVETQVTRADSLQTQLNASQAQVGVLEGERDAALQRADSALSEADITAKIMSISKVLPIFKQRADNNNPLDMTKMLGLSDRELHLGAIAILSPDKATELATRADSAKDNAYIEFFLDTLLEQQSGATQRADSNEASGTQSGLKNPSDILAILNISDQRADTADGSSSNRRSDAINTAEKDQANAIANNHTLTFATHPANRR